jgi:hypothetical protein
MHSRIALITFLDAGEVDPGFGNIGIGGGHPSHGLPGGGHVSGQPVFPPGHPSAGLPIPPGHPSHPISGTGGGSVTPPIAVPPNVIWPPQFPPTAGQLPTPPSDVIGSNPPAAPAHPIAPGQPLPENAAFVAVYTVNKGWQSTVIKAPPATAQPK